MIFISIFKIYIASLICSRQDTAWYSFCLAQEKCVAEPYTTEN